MSKFSMFMEKLVHEVEAGQPAARRVRLLCEGTTFETWEPIQGVDMNPEQWGTDVETLIAALLDELPKRRCQLSLVAEDSTGATLGTVLHTVTGRNANAQDLGTQNGAKAIADSLVSIAKTMDAVGESARKMMQFQADQLESVHKTLFEYHELFMAIRKAELDTTEEQGAVAKVLQEQVVQATPVLLELVSHWAKQSKKTPAAAAVAAVTSTNGAS